MSTTKEEDHSAEMALRDLEAPRPKTTKELVDEVNKLVDMKHDYGTCVYAMSIAATAAFNYVAGKLGVTGFQASCADMDIIRRTRHLNGGFIILKAEDLLYPQYSLPDKLQEFIVEQRDWLRTEAKKKLIESPKANQRVVDHWKKLAS
jgi:hypothetical protein